MPGSCSVSSCNNHYKKTRNSGIHYHRFPKDIMYKKKWMDFCQRKGNWITESSTVCSEHFTAEDYDRDLTHELLGLPIRKFIKKEALPTLYSKTFSTIGLAVKARRDRIKKRNTKKEVDSLLKLNTSSAEENINLICAQICECPNQTVDETSKTICNNSPTKTNPAAKSNPEIKNYILIQNNPQTKINSKGYCWNSVLKIDSESKHSQTETSIQKTENNKPVNTYTFPIIKRTNSEIAKTFFDIKDNNPLIQYCFPKLKSNNLKTTSNNPVTTIINPTPKYTDQDIKYNQLLVEYSNLKMMHRNLKSEYQLKIKSLKSQGLYYKRRYEKRVSERDKYKGALEAVCTSGQIKKLLQKQKKGKVDTEADVSDDE